MGLKNKTPHKFLTRTTWIIFLLLFAFGIIFISPVKAAYTSSGLVLKYEKHEVSVKCE